MVRLVVYDTASGAILKVVLCPPDAAEDQARTGQAVLEADESVGDTTHHVVNGEIVPL